MRFLALQDGMQVSEPTSSDLVKRLRAVIALGHPNHEQEICMAHEAADRIEALEALLRESREFVETVSLIGESNWDVAKTLLPRIDAELKKGGE